MTIKKNYFSILLLLTVFAIFGHTLHYSFFIFDDSSLIYDNSLVSSANLKNIVSVWSLSSTPFIYNVWQAVSWFFGTDNALPYRFLNIFFHGINCFLVFIWMREILTTFLSKENADDSIQKASIFATFLYLVHPSHVESIVWVSSLKEVLATTFGLLSFLLFLKNSKSASLRNEILTVVFYCIGMLVHPTIGTLPFIYLWFDLFFFKRELKAVLYKNSIYIVILLIAVLLQKTYTPQLATGSDESFYVKGVTLLVSFFEYLKRTIIPWNYSFDYMMSPMDIIEKVKFSFSAKVKAIISCLIIWGIILSAQKKKFHFFYYSLTIFLLLLLVNLGLVGYAFQNISTVADRFLYFPLIGISLLGAFLYLQVASKFSSYKRLFQSFGLIYFLFLFSLTVYRTALWSSNSSLLASSVESGYKSYPLQLSLGTSYLREKEYDKAIASFKQAYRLTIDNDLSNKAASIVGAEESLAHLFVAYRMANKGEEGLAFLKEISEKHLVLSPELALSLTEFFIFIGDWYQAEQYLDSAILSSPEATNLKPLKKQVGVLKKEALMQSYLNLGHDFMVKKNFKEAKKYLERALEIQKELGKSLDHIKMMLNLVNSGKG